MSVRDQAHQHRWQRRVKDWLVVPHSAYPNPHDVTAAELQQHNTKGDCWICVHGVVYDVTRFLPYHPGGTKIVEQYAGRDCTPAYNRNHLKLDPEDVIPNCRVGLLMGGSGDSGRGAAPPPPPAYVERRVPLPVTDSVLGTDHPRDRTEGGDTEGAGGQPTPAGCRGHALVELAAQCGLYGDVSPDQLLAAALAVDSKQDDVTEAAALEALFATIDTSGTGAVRKAAVKELLGRIGELGAEGKELLASCPDPVTKEQFIAIVQLL